MVLVEIINISSVNGQKGQFGKQTMQLQNQPLLDLQNH